MDGLTLWHFGLDDIQEPNELLMAMAPHTAADDLALEHVEGSKERCGAVAFVIVGHGSGASLLHRQAGLGTIQRLDLALLVDREHDGVLGRIDVEPDNVTQLSHEVRVVRQLELPDLVRLKAMGAPDRRTALALMPQVLAIIGPVQWVASPGGSCWVSATTRAATSGPSGATREGRVLSRSKPSTPSVMNRSCQRHTQVLDFPVRRMIAFVPRPSAVKTTISARQACFCGALRFCKIALSFLRSEGFTVIDIPVRMRQTRMPDLTWESQFRIKCQMPSTASIPTT